MAWFKDKVDKDIEKANPSQGLISMEAGTNISSKENILKYTRFYEEIEVVNRGVNMIVDDVADIPCRVASKVPETREKLAITPLASGGVKRARVEAILNFEPNPFQDINSFKRNLIMDFILEGNIFIYWDGAYIYHLPAKNMTVIPDRKNYIAGYEYAGLDEYNTDEIIHIKENSGRSIYRGVPRLKAAARTMQLLDDMRTFQDTFFKNGAIPGLIIKTPNVMSEKIKERTLRNWAQKYNPRSGGNRPMIVDGGTEITTLTDIDFKKIGFQESIVENEKIILKALGIPPILMDGGNNANIRPNQRLYYLETIIPIVRKLNYAFERFFGFKIEEDVSGIPALQPELKEAAAYYSTLVNGGILAGNEGRVGLGHEPMEDPEMDKIRIPQNIAGSAVDATQGGRPEGDSPDE